MPAYQPVSSPFEHPFRARCSVCGSRDHEAHVLATGHRPFTFIGPCCQDAETRARVLEATTAARARIRAMVAERRAAVTAPDLGGAWGRS
jgi:hypothetical protein